MIELHFFELQPVYVNPKAIAFFSSDMATGNTLLTFIDGTEMSVIESCDHIRKACLDASR